MPVRSKGVRASAIVELGSSSPFDQTANELGSGQVDDQLVLLESPGKTTSTCVGGRSARKEP
jgi:hypothetical protein